VHIEIHNDFTRSDARTILIIVILQAFSGAAVADGDADAIWKPGSPF
jgi:hypothetical protein